MGLILGEREKLRKARETTSPRGCHGVPVNRYRLLEGRVRVVSAEVFSHMGVAHI